MRRIIKALGPAFAAVLALSAIAASGASAASFTASSYPATFTGEQSGTHTWTIQGQKLTCTKAHFEGTLSAASETISIKPTYEGCTAFGFANSQIHMNGCTYEQVLEETHTTPTHYWTGTTQLRCPAGKSITITSASGVCVAHIYEQLIGPIDFENFGVNNMRITFTGKAWKTITTKSSFLCPLTANEDDTSGVYEGTTDLKGTGGATLDIG